MVFEAIGNLISQINIMGTGSIIFVVIGAIAIIALLGIRDDETKRLMALAVIACAYVMTRSLGMEPEGMILGVMTAIGIIIFFMKLLKDANYLTKDIFRESFKLPKIDPNAERLKKIEEALKEWDLKDSLARKSKTLFEWQTGKRKLGGKNEE